MGNGHVERGGDDVGRELVVEDAAVLEHVDVQLRKLVVQPAQVLADGWLEHRVERDGGAALVLSHLRVDLA